MAQLVIKREPWWSTPFGKQVMIWVPVAGLQAATLAGLGYFYDRLATMELYGGTEPDFAGSARDVSSGVSVAEPESPQLVVASVSSVPVSGSVSLQSALEADSAKYTMQVGETFSAPVPANADVGTASGEAAASIVPFDMLTSGKKTHISPPVHTATKKTIAKQKTSTRQPESIEWTLDREARRTAAANLAGLNAERVARDESKEASVPVTPLPTANPARPFEGALTPVGIVTWIYIGELRDYGWHGQKLHVAPHSGLPAVGRNYRTQKIHGLYESPYGKRVMAGFQQGDTVTVLEVRQEANNKVWAKVRKVRSYGR